MTLGETLKLLRTEQGLTQPELADKARIEQSYLSKLENDKASPSFDIINRLAQALGLTGMGLIQQLSHSYINENLSHLPEVAAEYASVQDKREKQLSRSLLLAALMLLAGTALYLTGVKELVASDNTWFYFSDGVIRPGEHYRQFAPVHIVEINETTEEWEQRMRDNRSRIDRAYRISSRNLGFDFIDDVDGGKRFFELETRSNETPNPLNTVLEILGVVMGLAGILQAASTSWRHRRAR